MYVLIFLIVMLIGSVACTIVIPPYLQKIEPSGRVNFFGIKFLGK